jgi:hypothetical protein
MFSTAHNEKNGRVSVKSKDKSSSGPFPLTSSRRAAAVNAVVPPPNNGAGALRRQRAAGRTVVIANTMVVRAT